MVSLYGVSARPGMFSSGCHSQSLARLDGGPSTRKGRRRRHMLLSGYQGSNESWKEAGMPYIALRGLPESLHQQLKSVAKRSERSLNGEILARLRGSFDVESADVEALLRRIRLSHETIGQIDFSDDTLLNMRNAGRSYNGLPGLAEPAPD